MAEYTYKDIIIDPTSEEAKNAVGKECYFSIDPTSCLKNAKENHKLYILESIEVDYRYPFIDNHSLHYGCLIVKKEPSCEERAKKWIEENNLKVGDYVKVLRKTELYENRWGGVWVDEMSDYIGNALKVLAINSLNGLISLECDDTVYVFPYFVLEKVEPPKSKYVPFESIEEFVERYTEVKEGTEFGTFEDNLLQCGMWIKSKDYDDLSQVTVIREYGICIDTMSTIVLWKNLLDDFEFIDGTPCGKLVEESNA